MLRTFAPRAGISAFVTARRHWIQIFRDYYGPTHKAFAALDAAGQDALGADITSLLNRFNVASLASLVVPGEYLEVVITKHGG
jgi:hypothetical protein